MSDKRVMITTRLTAEQRSDLQLRAAQAGMSLQQYCMQLLFPQSKTEVYGVTITSIQGE